MSDLLTISDLRRETGQPAHIIKYAIDRFGPEPTGRIGISRVWRAADLPAIQASLQKTSIRSRLSERRHPATAK
jgi:hypothetical protein